jgi:exodeoxyribonuclease VII large subunit
MDNLMVFSVFEITRHLRQVIESSIEPLYVEGEVSNFVHHSSGHMYFNLKDEFSTLRCTFFKNQNYRLDFAPQNGQSVVCYGQITLYEKGGSYNLNVSTMSQSGLGEMQARFEALKKKLQAEGLFEESRKQALPRYPQKIGIITSPTGAALQDISNVLARRFPIEAWVYPAVVQGSAAPEGLIRGLKYFNEEFPVDLIIISRGGGSQEDLFCFNDEKLARAIAASRIPVISGVGHEIDFTISDFVADLRAPTPSAAAEIAVPSREDLLNYIRSLAERMALSASNSLGLYQHQLSEQALAFASYHPERLWQKYQQRFDMATMALDNVKHLMREPRIAFERSEQSFISSIQRFSELRVQRYQDRLDHTQEYLQLYSRRILDRLTNRLELKQQHLEMISPDYLLKQGWALVIKDGKIVRSIKDFEPGDNLGIKLGDGEAEVEVIETK